MPDLPTGTVTLLFTDIEGSTQLLQQQGERYGGLLAEYRDLLRAVFATHHGHEVGTEGDSFFVVFPRAVDAVAAAVAAQEVLATHPWPDGVTFPTRMGLHTGQPQVQAGDYVGIDVHRAARLMAAGHGGQVLLSDSTRPLVVHDLPPGVDVRDLGEHRLKDLEHPERIYQLVIPDLPSAFPPVASLERRPNNLPLQPTPFIGREQEVAALRQRLRDPQVRLLTLTGPGGAGKTRLALHVAADVLDAYVDGVWFVNLAPISDSDLVAATIATALGVRETGGQPLHESLFAYLRSQQLLLLLDNFEQVLPAAPLVADLLATARTLTVLVTSRAPLHLRGEQEVAVPPLAVPDLQHLPTWETLSQYDAVRLFIQRAQAVKADFQVTTANAPAVAEICARLDGLPLAIELAAARSKFLPPEALLLRLSSRLKLLTGGARDLPARQQTLRAAIDWSYSLLEPPEQTLFARLGVFAGGCTLEAVEAVCTAESDPAVDVLEGVASLVDKSLLRQVDGPDGEPRFVMLETIQEYAWERLETGGEGEAVRRHAAYYRDLAEAAEPELTGPQQGPWLEQLEREYENLRAALQWAIERGDVEQGLRLGGALWRFWEVRGHFSEGRQWLGKLLTLAGESSPDAEHTPSYRTARAKALHGAGVLARRQGDYAVARPLFEESLALRRALGDARGSADSLNNLGAVSWEQGDYGAARPLFEESLALRREVGDVRGSADSLNNLGVVACEQGDYPAARALFEESLALYRQLGHRWAIAVSLSNLGEVAWFQGDYGVARVQHEESLAIRRELGDKWGIADSLNNLGKVASDQGDYPVARAFHTESLAIRRELDDKARIAQCLEGFAGLAGAQAQPERVLRLAGAAAALREAMGAPLGPAEQTMLERRLEPARQALSEQLGAAAWAEGRAMSLEQAVAYALEEAPDG